MVWACCAHRIWPQGTPGERGAVSQKPPIRQTNFRKSLRHFPTDRGTARTLAPRGPSQLPEDTTEKHLPFASERIQHPRRQDPCAWYSSRARSFAEIGRAVCCSEKLAQLPMPLRLRPTLARLLQPKCRQGWRSSDFAQHAKGPLMIFPLCRFLRREETQMFHLK